MRRPLSSIGFTSSIVLPNTLVRRTLSAISLSWKPTREESIRQHTPMRQHIAAQTTLRRDTTLRRNKSSFLWHLSQVH